MGSGDFAGGFQAGGALFGAIGDIWGGLEKASGYNQEAKYYAKAAQYEKYSTGIKELAANRTIYQKLGQGRADIGASGLRLSGSAADVMRSSAAEGAITRNMIGIQGQIDMQGLLAQEQQAKTEANAAEMGGIFAGVGQIANAAADIAMMG